MINRPLLIYLVDDDNEDRMLFIEALNEIDMPVIIKDFDNGVSLINTLLQVENVLPDAIFLDLNMPLMTGEECIDDIRNEAVFSEIPIIIYSNYVDDSMVYRLKNKGANWYLMKPNSFDKLKNLLLISIDNIKNRMSKTSTISPFIIGDSKEN
jgi:CheY-like chemotaxis protein